MLHQHAQCCSAPQLMFAGVHGWLHRRTLRKCVGPPLVGLGHCGHCSGGRCHPGSLHPIAMLLLLQKLPLLLPVTAPAEACSAWLWVGNSVLLDDVGLLSSCIHQGVWCVVKMTDKRNACRQHNGRTYKITRPLGLAGTNSSTERLSSELGQHSILCSVTHMHDSYHQMHSTVLVLNTAPLKIHVRSPDYYWGLVSCL